MSAASPPDVNSRREELLEIAARVFARRGVTQCTMRQLAAAADVSPSSLYHYFDTKERITEDLVDRYWTTVLERYTHVDQTTDGDLSSIYSYIDASVEVSTEMRNEAVILHQDWHHLVVSLPRLEEYWRTATSMWMRRIDGAIREGSIRGDIDRRLIYRAIMGALTWVPRWFDPAGPLEPAEVAAGIRTIFATGIRS